MAKEVAEDVCVEHFVAILPYKPKRWVTCHQPHTMKDAVLLMEAYMLAKAGVYLKKNLQRQPTRVEQVKGLCKGAPPPNLSCQWPIPVTEKLHCLNPLLSPPSLFNKPKPKGLTRCCFGCGQTGHY